MVDFLATNTTTTRVDHSGWQDFRAYWVGLTVSTIGDSFTLVALPIAAYTVNRSSALVGFVDMMEILSGVLLGTFFGVLADRTDSRLVMWWSDTLRAFMLLGLAAMAYYGVWNAWTVLILAFGLGALRAFHDGAESSMLASIIPVDREMQAFARISAADSTSRLIGPFIGGLTLEIGLWAAFGVDAMTFVVAALIVATLPRQRHHDPDAVVGSFRAEFGEALTVMRAHPTYLALVGVGAFGNLAGLTMAGLFVPFATEVLHLGSIGFGFGLLLSLLGIGGLLGNWTAARQDTHDPRTAGLSMAGIALVVLLLGVFPSIPMAVLAMVAAGAAFGYYGANYTAYRQEVFPAEMLGRVTMATRTIFYLTMIVGFAGAGVIADSWGPDGMFVLFGGLALAGTLVIGFIPIPIDPATDRTI